MSMKNIKWLLGAFSMLLAMTTFTACSDDDDKLEVPVFPESVVLNCQPERMSRPSWYLPPTSLGHSLLPNYGANSL